MRALITFLVILALVVAAVAVSQLPGDVAVTAFGRQIEAPLATTAAALLVLLVVLLVIIGVLRGLVGGPGSLLRRRRERRRRDGYRALTRGMVAVAAGDAGEAQRFARKADALLAEPPLTLLLSAQAAQLAGDEDAAHRFFTEMLGRAETEFLGLRGLASAALKRGDDTAALRLVERAHELKPRAGWVLEALFGLRTRAADWPRARLALQEAQRARLVPPDAARSREATLALAESRDAAAAARPTEALRLAAKAQELAPGFAPAAAQHARLLAEAGKQRAAAKAVESTWRQAPHPLLVEAYAAIFASELPLQRMKRFEQLAAANPSHPESHLAAAEAALEAQLWGEARRHLAAAEAAAGGGTAPVADEAGDATGDAPGPVFERTLPGRLCRLMARLEEAENGNGEATRRWLARAAIAPRDPAWVCRSCEAESLAWEPLCPRCGSFDSLAWTSPGNRLPRDGGATGALPGRVRAALPGFGG